MATIDKCRADTLEHIAKVSNTIHLVIHSLLQRAREHDQSKLNSPELEIFAKHGHKLGKIKFGTDEYKKSLELIKPATDHHYAKNRHHPEHHPNGIEGMNLVDLIEMVCDWYASSSRNKNGNLLKSLEFNAKRYGIDKQLFNILLNTIKELGLH